MEPTIIDQFDKSEFWEILLNGMNITHFCAYFVLMLIGAWIHFGMQVHDSLRNDQHTPNKFHFWFMIKDNLIRLSLVLLMVWVNIVFFEEITGTPITAYSALMLGVSWDAIIGTGTSKSKGYGALKRDRQKLIDKYK